MKTNTLIVGLLIAILVILSVQYKQDNEREKKNAGPIRRWWPGHLMSYYYPFHVPLTFRRHHRFHRDRFRH